MSQEQKQGVYVTQEDIDAALQAAPQPEMTADVDDAKPLFLDEADIVDPEGSDSDDEYFGLLSQDDIEALLHGDLGGASGQEVQDEIDTLLQATNSEDAPPPDAEADPPGRKTMAQEDVEQLMREAADSGASKTEEVADEDMASGDGVSQDDIDRLMMKALDDGGDGPDGDGESEPAETGSSEPGGMLSQDDLDQLLSGLSEDDAVVEPEPAETGSGDPGGMLSQDDLDQLLAGALDDVSQDLEPDASGTASIAPDTEAAKAPDEAGGMLSQGDLDQLFAEASTDGSQGVEPENSEVASDEPEAAPEASGGTGSLISQDDLDELLGTISGTGAQDGSSGDSDGASDHISQDDINRLLKESMEEAEDLLDEDTDTDDADDLQEPVILAAEEPSSQASPASESAPAKAVRKKSRKKPRKSSRKKRVQRKHLVWASAAAGIVLTVSVAVVMMSSGPTETQPQPQPQPQVLTFSLDQTEPEMVDTPMLSNTSVHLPGFVVFAPANSNTVTYVAADLTLIVSEIAMVAVIKENEAFVRDIIYGTIRDELMTRDISAIDEISLELAIRKALGQIMARDAIGRIAFDRFQLV